MCLSIFWVLMLLCMSISSFYSLPKFIWLGVIGLKLYVNKELGKKEIPAVFKNIASGLILSEVHPAR